MDVMLANINANMDAVRTPSQALPHDRASKLMNGLKVFLSPA